MFLMLRSASIEELSYPPTNDAMLPCLPVELNELVLSYVDLDDKPTLLAVCLVNKLGHDLATPLLYRRIGAFHFDEQSDIDVHWLQRLCETLVKRPKLGTHVKEVCLQLGSDESMTPAQNLIWIDPDQYQRSLSNLPHDIWSPVIEQIRSSRLVVGTPLHSPLLGTLLLLLCRKATRVRVEHRVDLRNIPILNETLCRMSKHADLCGLRDIDLVNTSAFTEYKPSFIDFVTLIQLPSLRSFLTNALAFEDDVQDLVENVEGRLEHLTLTQCEHDNEDIAPLITCCPRLKSVTIGWKSRDYNYWADDFDILGDSIRTLSDLETICMTLPYDEYLDENDRGLTADEFWISPLGSLKDLQRLKSLTISSVALFGTRDQDFLINGDDEPVPLRVLERILPECLRNLTILSHDTSLVGPICSLYRDVMVTEQLENFKIYNVQHDRCIGQDGVEVSCAPDAA